MRGVQAEEELSHFDLAGGAAKIPLLWEQWNKLCNQLDSNKHATRRGYPAEAVDGHSEQSGDEVLQIQHLTGYIGL